jgi:hypothetical protein
LLHGQVPCGGLNPITARRHPQPGI